MSEDLLVIELLEPETKTKANHNFDKTNTDSSEIVKLNECWDYGKSGKFIKERGRESWIKAEVQRSFNDNSELVNILKDATSFIVNPEYGFFFSKKNMLPDKGNMRATKKKGKYITIIFSDINTNIFKYIMNCSVVAIITLNIDSSVYSSILAIEAAAIFREKKEKKGYMHHLRFWIDENCTTQAFLIEFSKIFTRFPQEIKTKIEDDLSVIQLKYLGSKINSLISLIGEEKFNQEFMIEEIFKKQWENIQEKIGDNEKWKELEFEKSGISNLYFQIEYFL